MLRLAAEKGDLEAFFKLGYHGRVNQKPDLVIYLKRAADLGHPNACAFLAEMCRVGALLRGP